MTFLRKIFFCLGTLALVFLLFFLGEMGGVFEGNFLGEFLSKNIAPYQTIEPQRYYFLLSLTSTWMVIFCFLNLKFSSNTSNIMTARLGLCAVVSILTSILYIVVWPGIADRRIPLSYKEWPVDFSSFLYQEDGFFESLTAILLLLAAIQFFRAGRYGAQRLLNRRAILALSLLSSFSMIIMMEEISWGQRIFSWENPRLITMFNYQKETNFHNFFNPVIADGERIFSIFISLALLTTILYRTRITTPVIRGLFPSDKYYYVSVLFFITGMISSELFEEILAVFLFFYSMDLKNFYSIFPAQNQNSYFLQAQSPRQPEGIVQKIISTLRNEIPGK